MAPKVSVVVPSYNHGRYLAARLDSILSQTFPDFEVIFLDDASPDDSLAVFENYRGHPKVRAIINETNNISINNGRAFVPICRIASSSLFFFRS